MISITRKLEFDAAHRITKHESKCKSLHGHRYAVYVTCEGELDSLGRVIDFSVIKEKIGGWIEDTLDHNTILCTSDGMRYVVQPWCKMGGPYVLVGEPTAENIAAEILAISISLLKGTGVKITKVKVDETPNCSAEVIA